MANNKKPKPAATRSPRRAEKSARTRRNSAAAGCSKSEGTSAAIVGIKPQSPKSPSKRKDEMASILRMINEHFADPNPLPARVVAVEELATELLKLKDRKFALKVRISGTLSLLAKRVLDPGNPEYCTITMLQLISRCCIRSPRNAQFLGRERRFSERFVGLLNMVSAMGDSSAGTPEPNLPDYEYLALAEANGTNKMARLVEILFFVSKNKKNKSRLLDQDVIPVLKTIFDTHFQRRFIDVIHLEIALVTLAAMRQFSRTKKGKEQLVTLSVPAMCETYLAELGRERDRAMRHAATEEKQTKQQKERTSASASQLQDSLCALYLRCMPQLPFPANISNFPLSFPLPLEKPSANRRLSARSLSKSPFRTKTVELAKQSQQGAISNRDFDASSDEDVGMMEEEEDSILRIMSDSNVDDQSFACEDEEEEDEAGTSGILIDTVSNIKAEIIGLNASATDGADQGLLVAKYSRQKPEELISNYQRHFAEFDKGTTAANIQSSPPPKNTPSPSAIPRPRKSASATRQPQQASQNQNQLERTSSSRTLLLKSPPQNVGAAVAGDPFGSQQHLFSGFAQRTKSVGRFVKIAYPELCDPDIPVERQPYSLTSEPMREIIAQTMANKCRIPFERRIVFDLDSQLKSGGQHSSPAASTHTKALGNDDLERIGRLNTSPGQDHLHFESRFESGNLWKAVQVSETGYELVLSPDINQRNAHFQWFYFEVSNNRAGVPYTFEIINTLKTTSMFSKGMQPVLFSVTEAARHNRPGWVRAGSSVCYYRNSYLVPSRDLLDNSGSDEKVATNMISITTTPKSASRVRTRSSTAAITVSSSSTSSTTTPTSVAVASKEEAGNGGSEVKNFFSVRFTLKFRHEADVCYIAYHFPYTYSYLRATLEWAISKCSAGIFVRQNCLTTTLAGNPVPIVTITAANSTPEQLTSKQIVLISARVHPGESNSSWIIHGLLCFLLSEHPKAVRARELFVFKLIPMLNPDGVINGSHRCSLSGIDLNRTWNDPSPSLHPTIFHAKGLIQYMVEVQKKRPLVFIDLHGHSRKPNIFMYGNNPEESWCSADRSIRHGFEFLALPELLDKTSDCFSLKDSRFAITKSKEFSARVAMWRQFGIEAYTMESTYCGFDSGPHAGKQITIGDLKGMGVGLVEALISLASKGQQLSVAQTKTI